MKRQDIHLSARLDTDEALEQVAARVGRPACAGCSIPSRLTSTSSSRTWSSVASASEVFG
ncbi:hypothetical protein ACGFNP_07700 [Nonomuraea sp. NPDC049269]|uniref:hypothetical protein n=1 Tax=Nonomuraea sp. NPDC049269 TaxID=3364349 RepID=UPI00371D10AC